MHSTSNNAVELNERKRFHAIFNHWLAIASDEDYLRLSEAREQFAPNQVCSAISLVRGCLARPPLVDALPQSLRQLLQERCWPQAFASAPAA